MSKIKEFFSNLNNKIGKLSKLTLLLIVVVYTLALVGVYALVNHSQSYITIPQYSHAFFNEEINPQITMIANTSVDGNDIKVKYTVSVSIYGRINETSSADPQYKISNFKMSAATVSNVKSNVINNMYYFTEHSANNTPIVHTYTVDCTSVGQHPSSFYTMLQYKKGTNSKIATYKEEVMLQPTASDIESLNASYAANAGTNATAIDFSKVESKLGNLQFIAKENDDSTAYSMGAKITMASLSYQSRYHIDMQSWVETTTEDYLPFIGVYSYSNQKQNFVQSGRTMPKDAKPKYICAKLVYYYSENEYDTFYFKQDITALSTSFVTNPNVGEEVGAVEEKPSQTLNVLFGCLAGLVAVVLTIVTVTLINKYKKSKNQEDEAQLDDQADTDENPDQTGEDEKGEK